MAAAAVAVAAPAEDADAGPTLRGKLPSLVPPPPSPPPFRCPAAAAAAATAASAANPVRSLSEAALAEVIMAAGEEATAEAEPPPPPRQWRREELDEWLNDADQAHITLDPDQRRVVDLACREKRSVFYTGPGGVGKSHVTSVIVAFLRAVYLQGFAKAVAITAPTGIAATHIGGTTIHSAVGVGVPTLQEDFEARLSAGAGGGKGKQLAQQLEVLLVDEVSMLAAEFLDLLDEQMRRLVAKFGHGPDGKWRGEKPSKVPPFGGVQLICCGDFFQLPPIPGRVPLDTWGRLDGALLGEHRAVLRTGLDQRAQELYLNRGFAFQSSAWWEASLVVVELARVWRQKDAELVGVLNRVRRGQMTAADCAFLNRHCATAAGAPPRPPPMHPQARPPPPPPRRVRALPAPRRCGRGRCSSRQERRRDERMRSSSGVTQPTASRR